MLLLAGIGWAGPAAAAGLPEGMLLPLAAKALLLGLLAGGLTHLLKLPLGLALLYGALAQAVNALLEHGMLLNMEPQRFGLIVLVMLVPFLAALLPVHHGLGKLRPHP